MSRDPTLLINILAPETKTMYSRIQCTPAALTYLDARIAREAEADKVHAFFAYAREGDVLDDARVTAHDNAIIEDLTEDESETLTALHEYTVKYGSHGHEAEHPGAVKALELAKLVECTGETFIGIEAEGKRIELTPRGLRIARRLAA